MKERPILFKGEMVRAILAGQKTQTRRIVKLPLIDREFTGCEVAGCEINSMLRQGHDYLSPFGKPGDHLWVKETFLLRAQGTHRVYKADLDSIEAAGIGGLYGGWKPSIFMPRTASRITLEIASVRVERLQQITDGDVAAEGIEHRERMGRTEYKFYGEELERLDQWTHTPAWSYESLWDKINGKDAWKKNPWVWVVEFKRVKWQIAAKEVA